MSARLAEWVAIAFFAALGALVFQQVATSMAEQGIASGGPYDNAASYPRNIAILMLALLAVQLVRDLLFKSDQPIETASLPAVRRAVGLLAVFAIYLVCLDWLGYHLSTTPMAMAVMWLCGARNLPNIVSIALGMAFVMAFAFEKVLNVVLPGGIFGLNIPW
ncbi:MAG: tripartite tricarboxylate transporter TctB family protein [Boseongicola sp. SB0664_bin_43]|uniref:Tripartite tricarboxylate transporter TctB family protein n=1 Tax=Boseongicola sp. SB0664_bin_43 TaxID=2604844 RepID=A0A6B0XYB5_9RHOB|nr:tripartite tricarboxylate transporter TctB family protein [Boseongicola sp. SB0664_bin_43]